MTLCTEHLLGIDFEESIGAFRTFSAKAASLYLTSKSLAESLRFVPLGQSLTFLSNPSQAKDDPSQSTIGVVKKLEAQKPVWPRLDP